MAITKSKGRHAVMVDPAICDPFPGSELPYPGDSNYQDTMDFLNSLPSERAKATWLNWRRKYREGLKTGDCFKLVTMCIKQDEDDYLFVEVLGGVRVHIVKQYGYWTSPEPVAHKDGQIFSQRASGTKTKSKTRSRKSTVTYSNVPSESGSEFEDLDLDI